MGDTDPRAIPKGLPWTFGQETILGTWLFGGRFPMPTAVLRLNPLAANIHEMARFCSDHNVLLAPHAKTTMSPEIIHRQMSAGAWGMTVATAWQAAQVTAMGVQRILIANEVTDAGSLALLGELMSRNEDVRVWCWVDSKSSLSLVEKLAAHADQLSLLVEFGIRGGRTGLREAHEVLDLAHRVAAGPFVLTGFSGFEGIIATPQASESIALVDEYFDELAALTRHAWQEGLLAGAAPAFVSVGGSAYQDRAALHLASALHDLPIDVVIRSGCYVTHDARAYHAISPFGQTPRMPYTLQEAIEVWGPVLSIPEHGKAIAGLGRRDASFDAGFPVARRLMRSSAQQPEVIPPGSDNPVEVVGMNDQHTYLTVDPHFALEVGDLIGFGISHPCTTFDKWGSLPIIDDSDIVVDIATTHFV